MVKWYNKKYDKRQNTWKCNLWKHPQCENASDKQSFHVIFSPLVRWIASFVHYCKGLIVFIVFFSVSLCSANPFYLFFCTRLFVRLLLIIDINYLQKNNFVITFTGVRATRQLTHTHKSTTIPKKGCTLISFSRSCNLFCHDNDDDDDAHKLSCCKFYIPMKMFTN